MPAIPTATINVEARPPHRLAFMRRGPLIGAQVRAILGLPNDDWCDLEVEFGLDDVARAKVTLLLTPEQLASLASLAGDPGISTGRG